VVNYAPYKGGASYTTWIPTLSNRAAKPRGALGAHLNINRRESDMSDRDQISKALREHGAGP